MTLLILGVVIFFGIHLLPAWASMRDRWVQALGEKGYKAVFSVVSLIGFVLIVYGKSAAPFYPLWNPVPGTLWLTHVLVALAFISVTAAYMPGNLKRFTPHPMLWGTALWAGGHLLANGDKASVLLFAAFGVYALVDIASANSRGASRQTGSKPWAGDILAIVVGIALYALVMWFHPALFGVAVTGF